MLLAKETQCVDLQLITIIISIETNLTLTINFAKNAEMINVSSPRFYYV